MKKIFILSLVSVVLSAESYALPQKSSTASLELQVDQTKVLTPNADVKGATAIDPVKAMGVTGATGATGAIKTPNAIPSTALNEKQFTTDHELADAIYKAIRNDRIFSSDSKVKIQVSVYNGKVTLTGDVSNEAEKARAELLATQINRLQSVTNNLKIIK